MRILGISAFYHDSAAALVEDGEIVAAAQEERFTRRKHDSSFPGNAARFCLSKAGGGLRNVDYVVFYEKPLPKFERLLETYIGFAPAGSASFRTAFPLWIKQKLFQKQLLEKELRKIDGEWNGKLLFTEHHQSHAASAFFASPFEGAAILTMDGVGEWPTTSFAIGQGNELKTLREIHFPHSLGLLYSAFTYYTGFRVNSGEYKLMGLAPYGRPLYAKQITDHLIDVKPDGSFQLNMEYFNYCVGLTMTNRRFDKLFGGPPRKPDVDAITQRHMDLAASVQAVLEDIVLKMSRSLAADSGMENLCLAGGVALNCVANGKLLRDGAFRRIWIQPASGDAGGAVGAALAVHHLHLKEPRRPDGVHDAMHGAYLGPEFSDEQIEQGLKAVGAQFQRLCDDEMVRTCAAELAEGKAVGWFQGRMEFGPRALGARSILGDPRSPHMQRTLNLKVKYRESFRPFAPAVTREALSDWFEIETGSPYMLLVADVKKERCFPMNKEAQQLFGIDKLNVPRSEIPAVTHVDYSARIQTVSADTNPRFYNLLKAFERLTGCPVLVNTSFNVRGEPIVCTPEDAFRCFMGTEIDLLAVGNYLTRKLEQAGGLRREYHTAFALD
ncbi:MAG TPA: carbamoyltransferase [Bryobacteraceae bacterium]|nr:carbamoyltransferase [Bryobacteraceae bacterium]